SRLPKKGLIKPLFGDMIQHRWVISQLIRVIPQSYYRIRLHLGNVIVALTSIFSPQSKRAKNPTRYPFDNLKSANSALKKIIARRAERGGFRAGGRGLHRSKLYSASI